MSGRVGLSIVIVNWNAGPRLRQAITSVASAPPRLPWEIVVVDNASTDGSLRAVHEDAACRALLDDGRLRLLANDHNRGFAAANNQAFRATTGSLLLLLNPDAAVAIGAIDRLIDVLESDPGVGMVGPQLVGPDGAVQVSVWRTPPRTADVLVSHLGLYRLLPRSVRARWLLGAHWDHDERRAVPMIIGAAMLVRRRVIDQVGGLDERFHVFGEDHEWSQRIGRAGWRIVFEPAAKVAHEGAASTSQRWDRLEAVEQHVRAEYLLCRISLGRWELVLTEVAQCIGTAGQAGARWLRGLDRRAQRAALRLHRAHLADAVSRALGRIPDDRS